jgi:hypothetical protein
VAYTAAENAYVIGPLKRIERGASVAPVGAPRLLQCCASGKPASCACVGASGARVRPVRRPRGARVRRPWAPPCCARVGASGASVGARVRPVLALPGTFVYTLAPDLAIRD